MTTPTVDVCMLTYNHAAYIEQAIESVLAQKTNFAVRLVIGDDCSTDATRQLVAAYAERYPAQFKLLFYERNIGIMPNLVRVLESCEAPFIAVLDGDDYWTDPDKLQQQVDFLTAHAAFSLCAHDVLMTREDGQPATLFSSTRPLLQQGIATFTHADVIRNGWFLPSASLLFRRAPIRQLPAWFPTVFSGDYSLHLLLSQAGLVHYSPATQACYRIHARGASYITPKNETNVLAKMIVENNAFRNHFASEHRAHFTHIISQLQFRLGVGLLRQGRVAGMGKSWLVSLTTDTGEFRRNLSELLGRTLLGRTKPTHRT
jgi:glycosyltransferase involved in cell wall biosynthesis